jgi:hypothetical protein
MGKTYKASSSLAHGENCMCRRCRNREEAMERSLIRERVKRLTAREVLKRTDQHPEDE